MTVSINQDSPYAEELRGLSEILQPLGDDRVSEILELAERYMELVTPYTWCCSPGEDGQPDLVWEVLQPSPISNKDAPRIVFAIFDYPAERCALAYSFQALQSEGGDGRTMGAFFREKISHPKYLTGPISLAALHEDLTFHLSAAPDDEDKPTNGQRD